MKNKKKRNERKSLFVFSYTSLIRTSYLIWNLSRDTLYITHNSLDGNYSGVSQPIDKELRDRDWEIKRNTVAPLVPAEKRRKMRSWEKERSKIRRKRRKMRGASKEVDTHTISIVGLSFEKCTFSENNDWLHSHSETADDSLFVISQSPRRDTKLRDLATAIHDTNRLHDRTKRENLDEDNDDAGRWWSSWIRLDDV